MPQTDGEKGMVQSVQRSFALLEALAAKPAGAAVTELAAATGLAKSTAHRLLANLIAMGYAGQDEESGRYHATLKMFEVASGVASGFDIVTFASRHLDKLAEATGEAVHLVVPDGADIVYLYKADASSMRMSSRVGLRRPMYCTGVGKAILAALPYKEAKRLWRKSDVQPLTAKTLVTFEELEKQLTVVRRRGWAVDDEENELGIRCVATALPGPGGLPAAAFSVTGLAAQMDDARLEEIATQCLLVKAEISRSMGLA